MIHLMKSIETRNEGSDDCVVVENGAEMAVVLARASRAEARSFAITMHERACAAQDETALAFWCDVLKSQTLNGDALNASVIAIRSEDLVS